MLFNHLEHRFCTHVPESLEPGVLYVSMEFATAAHSCCCGCGEEVVTPFTPTDWKMAFNGQAISLWPSIGNWALRCRSHYVIKDGRVIESRPWTENEIAAERRRDRAAKARYYGTVAKDQFDDRLSDVVLDVPISRNWWQRFQYWVLNRLWRR